jgi:hypothetical protein
LGRVETGRSHLRGSDDEKAQKIEALRKSILDLEQKLSTQQSEQEMVHSAPSSGALQIIQNALAPSFNSGQAKQEELDALFPMILNGPGSEQDPMQIDCGISEGQATHWCIHYSMISRNLGLGPSPTTSTIK